VSFRNEILRGVRLSLIVFAAILIGVWIYRMLHAPSDVQGAEHIAPAAYEAVPPEAQPAPKRLRLPRLLPNRTAWWFPLRLRWLGRLRQSE